MVLIRFFLSLLKILVVFLFIILSIQGCTLSSDRSQQVNEEISEKENDPLDGLTLELNEYFSKHERSLNSFKLSSENTQDSEHTDTVHGNGLQESHPEIPAKISSISTLIYQSTDKSGREVFEYSMPTIPFGVSTSDGRIAASGFDFYLYKPEKLNSALLSNSPGAVLVDYNKIKRIKRNQIHNSPNKNDDNFFKVVSASVCDGTPLKSVDEKPKRSNPYQCSDGFNQKMDCYDLTLFTSYLVCPPAKNEDGSIKKCTNPVTNGLPHWIEVWEAPITVKVADPKTKKAKIKEIVYLKNKEELKGLKLDGWNTFIEIVFTADGRFVIARSGHGDVVSKINDKIIQSDYEIVYAVSPQKNNPCDLSGFVRKGPLNNTQDWSPEEKETLSWVGLNNTENIVHNFKPIAVAPYDQEMIDNINKNKRYGIAIHPFRDTEGSLIPADPSKYDQPGDLQGTYPWIDPTGSMMMFDTISANLYYSVPEKDKWKVVKSRRPARNAKKTISEYTPSYNIPIAGGEYKNIYHFQDGTSTRGISILGSWTKGKMVLLDGKINNMDYGIRTRTAYRKEVQLYQENTGSNNNPKQDGWIELGDGREATPMARFNYGKNGINTNFIESLANKLNYIPKMKPSLARDLVWTINTGRLSEEQAFDEYVSNHVLINAEMTGSLSWNNQEVFKEPHLLYHDGFSRTEKFFSYDFGSSEVHFQNSSTSTKWDIPSYGFLSDGAGGGQGRLEPVALGGIFGKGLWLESNTGLNFIVPPQKMNSSNEKWYVGVFLDRRFYEEDLVRRLWSVISDDGNGFSFNLLGSKKVQVQQIGKNQQILGSFDLPVIEKSFSELWPKAFRHMGFLIHPKTEQGEQSIELYWNGFKYNRINIKSSIPVFRLEKESRITLGGSKDLLGLRGWVDDFKVISGDQTEEELCNYARGTLIGMGDELGVYKVSETQDWGLNARVYPKASHEHISTWLRSHGKEKRVRSYYACYTRYGLDYGAHLNNLPPQVVSLRNDFLFPEGPIVFDKPRPNSMANSFCLSCHLQPSENPALSVQALLPGGGEGKETAFKDARRLPIQHLQYLRGVVPKNHFGSNRPSEIILGQEKIPIDSFVDLNSSP